MSDAVDRGITVTEIASLDEPIDVCPETTAAFVGRALRGPLNTPVLVRNFGEFRRRFGDVWGRSSLGPAAKQFFEHGGKQLFVVRVANDARGAMLVLPARGSALVLRAVDPGSTENVRASVDYDGIDAEDDEHFNLTLQRVDPSTGHVIDQEFFRALSYDESSSDFAGDELLTSELARVEHPYPTHRPERTLAPGSAWETAYTSPAQAGSDGVELSNYDLVGSRADRTGLFALEQVDGFDILYLPPPGKGRDTGPAAILAAEMYCRERGAMLIVDPLAGWDDADAAVDGVRELGYRSPNMLGYFPRMVERGSDDDRPVGGAIAGLLCKQDRTYGPWQDLDRVTLHRHLRPAIDLDDEDEAQLRRSGLNCILNGHANQSRVVGSMTMGRGSEADRKFMRLPVRRFCLQMINTIARATRWAVFEPLDANLANRIRGQVLTYFDCLNDLGAFATDHFVVQCDAGVSHRRDEKEHGITLLLLFHPVGCDEPVSMTLHQTPSGCRVGSTAFGLSLHA